MNIRGTRLRVVTLYARNGAHSCVTPMSRFVSISRSASSIVRIIGTSAAQLTTRGLFVERNAMHNRGNTYGCAPYTRILRVGAISTSLIDGTPAGI